MVRLVVRRRLVMGPVLRAVMIRGVMPGLFEVLLHHRAAVLVLHELLVGHAVALADCALREILMLGLRLMMRFRVMTRLALVMRASVMARRAVVG